MAETRTGRVYFDIGDPGEIVNPAPFPSPHGGTCWPACRASGSSTLAVDSAGNVCVATLFTPGITVISPDGQDIEYIDLPDPYVTNICFGGPDLKTAYVTLSAKGRLIAFDWPRPGLPLNYLNT